jgi:hypothetical protein
MQRKTRPSAFMIWKMYRSWVYETRVSPPGGNFSRMRRDIVLAFPDAALNSARTTVPLATKAYRIVMFPSSPPSSFLVTKSNSQRKRIQFPLPLSRLAVHVFYSFSLVLSLSQQANSILLSTRETGSKFTKTLSPQTLEKQRPPQRTFLFALSEKRES